MSTVDMVTVVPAILRQWLERVSNLAVAKNASRDSCLWIPGCGEARHLIILPYNYRIWLMASPWSEQI